MPSSEPVGKIAPRKSAPAVRWLAHAGRAAVSILVALLLAEGGMRVAGVRFTGSFYTSDPTTGWTLRPNAEGWSNDERTIYVRINSTGMHDREHSVAKPSRTFRIAVLGDSTTASIEVAVSNTSCAVMEGEFANCTALRGRKVEVLNFGVPGFNTAQMLLVLQNRVWKYSPDAVLLELFSGNELLNNRRDLTNADPSSAPFYVLRDEKLCLDDSYRSNPAEQPSAIRRHDRMADWMNRLRLLGLVNRVIHRPGAANTGLDPRIAKYGEDFQLHLFYTPPAYPEIEDAWRVTEGIVTAIRDDVRSHEVPFWLALSSAPGQTQEAHVEKWARWGPDSLLYPDWRLKRLAEREQIPVVWMTPYLQKSGTILNTYLSGWQEGHLGVGHWNELGQRVVGEYLGKQLCSMLAR
jgi:hypothetical protein